jgi:hypothetical protein
MASERSGVAKERVRGGRGEGRESKLEVLDLKPRALTFWSDDKSIYQGREI